jgi:glycosyltransferase involved in cell wall biosynthesis
MNCKQVLIDLLRLKDLNTGLGQVCLSYGKALAAARHPNLQFTFLVPHNFVGYFGQNVHYLCPSLIQNCFPSLLRKRFDLWHSIHQDVYYFPAKHTTWVLTIHDLNFMYEKAPFKMKKRKKRLNTLLHDVTQVVAISNFTKQEIEEKLVLQTPVQVVYNGVNILPELTCECPAYASPGNFFLSIGVFKPNKNYESLIRLMRDYPDKRLIIAGSYHTAYGQQLKSMIHKKELQNKIITPGVVSETEKAGLYAHCEALLFPSTNEGMGLPIIEAMRFGKPVIASNMSSIPEFGSDYAYYFKSFDPAEMRQTIEESLAHFRQHPERKKVMQHYAGQFSWKKNAEQYIRLFERILKIDAGELINKQNI